ncbi:hypothetical protein [Nocardia seriolae]|uniref:hypothetical protein n=1 Tax=Nocardia seriolae TaxID=37332 RepID=UPI0008FF5BDD|nr:hypothetical protein [Nocardia seriolae]OJF80835.1 hypothetical protein NS14008_18530 [Nocardia seriolae]QOW35212.1 hypothetical protein IMZ23_09730 [Nocardia seriolae]QUN17322.1 hypothetical protein KEC46_35265 [Nocardia seriolae]WNJ62497.1 hypothetical protein RMO66_18420 [Nocardia seriolae]
MTFARLSDGQIAAMSDEERRALIRRLQPPPERVLPRPEVVRVHRRVRLALMVGGCIALIPWIVYLGFSLPAEYHARHWSMAWIGFDILLVLMMATTAYLGWRRRVALILPAFGTGLLLLVDVWFDIVTADAGDMWVSIGTAILGEVPLAVLQISGAIMLLRFLILAHPLHDPAVSPLRTRLPF